VPLPVGDQADQQVRAAQQRAVDRLVPAEGQVVAAAGAGVEPVEVELLRRQLRQPCLGVEGRGELAQLRPAPAGLHVDLDHARVRRHRQLHQPRVRRRLVALDHDRRAGRPRGRLHDVQQVGVVVEPRGRWQEDVHVAVALLEGQRRAVGTLRVREHDGGHARDERLPRFEVRRLGRRRGIDPRDRVQRQAEPDRARAGREHQPAAPEPPHGAGPAGLVGGQREHPAGGVRDVGVEPGDQVLGGVVLVGGRAVAVRLGDVGGERGERVLEGRAQLVRGQPEQPGHLGTQLEGPGVS